MYSCDFVTLIGGAFSGWGETGFRRWAEGDDEAELSLDWAVDRGAEGLPASDPEIELAVVTLSRLEEEDAVASKGGRGTFVGIVTGTDTVGEGMTTADDSDVSSS